MLKVLQVCSDTNIGGAGKCILTYLAHCDKSRFDTAVVLPVGSLLKPHVEALGFPVFEVDAMADKSLDSKAVRKLLGVFRSFRPDIVHTHASMAFSRGTAFFRRLRVSRTAWASLSAVLPTT